MESIISLKWAHIQNCYLCKQVSDNLICETCENALPFLKTTLEETVPSSLVRSASAENLLTLPNVSKALGNITFNRLICPMLYRWPIDFMIKQFKFSRSDYLTQSLCKYLLHDLELQLNDTTRPDIIIPVPIHIKRYGTRRFNQATLIAEHLSHGLAIPLNTHFCKRQQFAFAQSQLGGDKRRKNLKRAFSAEPMLGIKRVAIVDDVITTGATVEALSRAIKHRNPHINIDVWTLAISDKNLGLD